MQLLLFLVSTDVIVCVQSHCTSKSYIFTTTLPLTLKQYTVSEENIFSCSTLREQTANTQYSQENTHSVHLLNNFSYLYCRCYFQCCCKSATEFISSCHNLIQLLISVPQTRSTYVCFRYMPNQSTSIPAHVSVSKCLFVSSR